MKKKIMKQWVAALRSGEFKQGKGLLENEGTNCCLGVLCNLAMLEGVCDYDNGRFDDLGGVIPISVKNWSGVRNFLQSDLIDLNDRKGKSFKQIANYIEKNWDKV